MGEIISSFNSRKLGELAIKTVFMEGKEVSMKYPSESREER